ncbi:MAG: EAL domain-containing protein [Candidatus Accumulibacter sp.]|nr:EAL domain-containing protein [Accumulibacter sp.]
MKEVASEHSPESTEALFRKLPLQLSVFFLLLIGAIWGAIFFQLQYMHTQEQAGAQRDNENLARAFAEQVHASLRGIDLSLLALREEWQRNPSGFHAAVLRQQNYFVREVSFQIGIIDAGGNLVYSNLEQPAKPVSLADREHFRVHRERGSDRLFVSKPVLGRVSQRWSIQFTRPILGPDRRFLGVVVMSVPPEYFSRFYDSISLGQHGSVTLVRSSGEILARSPDAQRGIGISLVNRDFVGDTAPETGSYLGKGQVDGVERLYTWRRLAEFGLVVLVGQSTVAVLESYRTPRLVLLIGGGALSVLLLLFAYSLIAGLRQRARAAAALASGAERDRLLIAALEAVGNGVVITDVDARIEWVNPAFEALTGYTRAEASGRRPAELVSSGAQKPAFYADLWNTILAGKTWRGEVVNKHKDGSLYDEELVITPVRDGAGLIRHFVGVKQDISERRRTAAALRESQERWQFALEGAGDAVWDWDVASGAIQFSRRLTEILGVDEGAVGQSFDDWQHWIHPDDLPRVQADVEAYLAGASAAFVTEHRTRCGDGGVRWILARGMAVSRDASGRPLRLIGTQSDVTERKLADEQLRVAAVAFESQEGMMVTDATGVILRVNRAFCELTGYAADDVVGQTPAILKSGRQDREFYREMWRDIAQKGHWQGEIWNRKKCGALYPEWLVITAVQDEGARITHYVAAFSDITTRKEAEAQIRNLAFYDPLTELPNRRLLMDRLGQALAASARSRRHGALMLLDLDRFKTLNDTLGHDVGDRLLIEVARRIQACVREGDTAARLGGDEFVVMLEDLSRDARRAAAQAEAIAEKIREALGRPYALAGCASDYRSTSSIGVCQFLAHEHGVESLLKQADIALYQAKDAGRNQVRFYSAEMQAALEERARTESGLREALHGGGFLLHYQMQVDRDARVIGAEALLRWITRERSVVMPAQFIPLAEETGLILPIGAWVLESACRQLALWAATPARGLVLAINVSARQFRQPDFVAQVQQALAASGADPACLKLELTESAVLDDVDDSVAKMQALRALGVSFSLDDFGTGYSSLSYLKRLPLDQVKIDQSFVRDIAIDQSDAAIAQTIISMSRTLGLHVVAEGVETEEQHAFLHAHGCEGFQGYLFSRPLVLAEFEGLLAQPRQGRG